MFNKNNETIIFCRRNIRSSFTITVTNISASRVSGTFSGKEKIAEGQLSGKSELTVTDRKFDPPVRNVSN
ncbi:MAG TPA: hypothetical protein VGP55_03950 [Chitinophagaceae bacterium]|nr:hypothetical protein [Chitinophagaceae bacterium]